MPESRHSAHYFVDTTAKNHVEPVQNSPCKISVELMFGNFYVKALGRFRSVLIFLIFSTNVFSSPPLL